MFDELRRELQGLEGGAMLPIEMPLDDDGYFDRQCASVECGRAFKVLFEDWRDKVPDEQAFCPICRYEADSGEWNNEAQDEFIQSVALDYLSGKIDGAIRRDADRFNQRQPRNSLISISFSYRSESRPVLVTPEAADAMRQNHTCEACACRYATIGAAFFCPACGKSSVEKTFNADIDSAIKTITCLLALRIALQSVAGDDAAENTARLVLESTHANLVGICQHYVERLYATVPGAPRARRNVFQTLEEASALWKTAIGTGYEDILDSTEHSDLVRLFQQRHLIAHKGGIVDADYVAKSGDTAYAAGQRIVVKEQSVLRLADLVRKLGNGVRSSIH